MADPTNDGPDATSRVTPPRPARPSRIERPRVNTLTDDDSAVDIGGAAAAATETAVGRRTIRIPAPDHAGDPDRPPKYRADPYAIADEPAAAPPGYVNPVAAAARAVLRQRALRLALIAVLAVPAAVVALYLAGLVAGHTVAITLGAVILFGGSVRDALADGLVAVMTLRLWIEGAATVLLLTGLFAGVPEVWVWTITVSVAYLLVRMYFVAVSVARASRLAVLEVRRGG